MTAHDDPQLDPQQDAASLGGVPESTEESARARDLAELFGPLVDDQDPSGDVDASADRERLAALFGGLSSSTVAADPEPDFSWRPDPPVTDEPASAWAREPDMADRADNASDSIPSPEKPEPAKTERESLEEDAETAVIAGSGVAASALPTIAARHDALVESSELDALSEEDPLAWLDRLSEQPIDSPEKAALGSWLGNLNRGSETTALPAAVVAAATADQTQVLPEAAAGSPAGSFFPAQRRGIRGWSSRVRWSVALSIVLLIGVVVASVVIAQTIAANNVAAQELAAAVADLEAAEETAEEPQFALDEAIKIYNATAETARATADSAGPPLAAIAGMAAQPLLDASNAALAGLVAQLDASTLDDVPEPYERGDVDVTDIEEVRAATQVADAHAGLVSTATREVTAAQAALQEKVDALRAAQVALGASLPETAVVIVGENDSALRSFRDAVIAASVAVPAAQNAGGTGDAELLAYAAAVTALRGDQARAIAEDSVFTPPSTVTPPAPDPAPAPDPVPPPDPQPTPTPEPTEPVPPIIPPVEPTP